MWNPYLSVSAKNTKILGFASILSVLCLWSVLSGFELVPKAMLPSPKATMEAFVMLWNNPKTPLLEAILYSSGRVLISGLLVVLVGVPIGILMGASPKLNAFLSPLVDPFRSAPVAAFLPLFVMWFGIGETMKVAFLFLGAVVYLIPMVRDAMRAVPQTYWISAHDLGATPFEAVRKAVVPMAKPRIADAIVVAVSIMWTYITVAEFVNAQKGLGKLLSSADRMSSTSMMFAVIAVIIVLALLTYHLMLAAKRRLYPWEVE